MIRLLNTLFLIATLVLTSVAVAFAHGQRRDQGTDLVICSGTTLITITIGPDRQPIKKVQVCPDAISIFAAEFAPPQIPVCFTRVVARLGRTQILLHAGQSPIHPTARDPPLSV